MDVLLFGREDFIAIRKYYKFLLQIGYRDVFIHPPEFAPVLELYAKELSDVAQTNLARCGHLMHEADVLSEGILDCVNRGEAFHAACRRAWLQAPKDRRVLLLAMRCDSFDFSEPDKTICAKDELTGVVDQLVKAYTDTLSAVEAFLAVVSPLGQEIHKLFVVVLKARALETSPPYSYAAQGTCDNWFFCGARRTALIEWLESITEDDLKRKAELDRLARVYASTSSALFNLGDFLYRVQFFLRTVIKRFSLITPLSRFSGLLLTCELVAEVLIGLRVRAERLGAWSEFVKIHANYDANEE